MNNRISKFLSKQEPVPEEEVRTFFLACEYKPGGTYWNMLEPFAYDIKPAFLYGTLGILSYNPECYSVVEVSDDCEPLMGYICTITHIDTISFLDRTKFYLGEDAFNMHVRKLIKAYTDIKKTTDAWCYLLSMQVLNSYQSLETVEFGLWDDDEKQAHLLEKIIH